MGMSFKTMLCASVVACLPTLVLAQDNAPRDLSPRNLTVPTEDRVVPSVTPVPVKTISGGINVQTLGDVSAEATGVLSGSHAFPSDMWSGISRPFAERLIARLPARPSAPYLRILQRRLLLSTATPPKGPAGPKSLLSLRAEKLAQMGQLEDVLSLIDSAPQNDQTDDLKMLEARVLLLAGQTSKACALAAQNIQNGDNPFWVKTLAFCRMLAKQGDQAMLSLSLLKEMGDKDPVYYSLMDALHTGDKAKVDDLPAPKALDIALIAATKVTLSDQVRQIEDPNFLRFLTQSGDVEATQKTLALNLASTDFLAEVYKKQSFSKDELGNPIASAENMPPFKAQALLYQVTTTEGQLAVIQAETINMALDLARPDNQFNSISRLYQPLLSKMNRSIDMLWFAPTAIRALLATGDWETAKEWYLMLRNAAFTDNDAAQNWNAVRPLAVLAGFDVSNDAVSQTLKSWWQAQPEQPESYLLGAKVFALVDGMGLPVPDMLWVSLINGPTLPDAITPKPGLAIKMKEAADEGQLGETVLMFLNAINHHKASDLDPTFLSDSLKALRAVGLERDARAVAVETALQAGL